MAISSLGFRLRLGFSLGLALDLTGSTAAAGAEGGSEGGVNLRDLQWRGCYNAEIAAFLLGKRLSEPGQQDFWTKAANYHSKTPKYNAIYRKKLVALSTEWANWLQNSYSVKVSYR